MERGSAAGGRQTSVRGMRSRERGDAFGVVRGLQALHLGEDLELERPAEGRMQDRRGLARVDEVGDEVGYDPEAHELNEAVAKTPKTVRIQARGVTRGGEVLAKPRVAPVDRKKRS